MTQLRVAVIGLAGSGKSTLAGQIEELGLERGLVTERIRLAQPLYDLQGQVYRVAGVPIAPYDQDQSLMEDLADALRRIRKEALLDHFLRSLSSASADIVLNEDLRDPHVDAPALRAAGFKVVRVAAPEPHRVARLAARRDISRSERSTAELDLIEVDARLDNDGDLAELREHAHCLLESWV